MSHNRQQPAVPLWPTLAESGQNLLRYGGASSLDSGTPEYASENASAFVPASETSIFLSSDFQSSVSSPGQSFQFETLILVNAAPEFSRERVSPTRGRDDIAGRLHYF